MPLKPNDKAPGFRLPELSASGGESDRHWDLRDMLKAGPAFIVFVKATCPTCAFAAPFVNRVFQGYPGIAASVVLIAQEDPERAATMSQEWGLELPVLVDSSPYRVSESYGLSFVPSGFLVSQSGLIENSFESFERETIREINRKLAVEAGKPPVEIFPASQGVPPFRPG